MAKKEPVTSIGKANCGCCVKLFEVTKKTKSLGKKKFCDDSCYDTYKALAWDGEE